MQPELLCEHPRIELYEGDCLEILPTFADKSFDLVLTDPPYGITACEWDVVPNLEKLWKQLKQVGKENCAYVFTASQPFTTDLINSNREWFKYEWIWDKIMTTGVGLVNKMPMRCHENIIVFYDKQCAYNPQKRKVVKHFGKKVLTKGESMGYLPSVMRDGIGYPRSIITIQKPSNLGNDKSGLHPTQKSKELFGYLIKTYTDDSDTILDPFAGSGTTGVAAYKLNRACTMIELEEKYCDIIRRRMDILVRQERMFT